MKPTLLLLILATWLMSSCSGTITSPYTGNSYDFSLKPHPVVKIEPAK